MTTLHDMAEAVRQVEAPQRKPRELDEIPELRDQHREALAKLPTPQAPEDRL